MAKNKAKSHPHLPKSPKAATSSATPADRKPRPRQQRLEGMDDEKIDIIHAHIEEYQETKTARIAALAREKELKDRIMGAMHAAGKKVYNHQGVHVELVPESEKLKVRIGDPEEQGDEDLE